MTGQRAFLKREKDFTGTVESDKNVYLSAWMVTSGSSCSSASATSACLGVTRSVLLWHPTVGTGRLDEPSRSPSRS